jgi:hypothetical protein
LRDRRSGDQALLRDAGTSLSLAGRAGRIGGEALRTTLKMVRLIIGNSIGVRAIGAWRPPMLARFDQPAALFD